MSVRFLKQINLLNLMLFLQEDEHVNLYNRGKREKHCHFIFDHNKMHWIFSLFKKAHFFVSLRGKLKNIDLYCVEPKVITGSECVLSSKNK